MPTPRAHSSSKPPTNLPPRCGWRTTSRRVSPSSGAGDEPLAQLPDRRSELGRLHHAEGNLEPGQVAREPAQVVCADAQEHAGRVLLERAQGRWYAPPR